VCGRGQEGVVHRLFNAEILLGGFGSRAVAGQHIYLHCNRLQSRIGLPTQRSNGLQIMPSREAWSCQVPP